MRVLLQFLGQSRLRARLLELVLGLGLVGVMGCATTERQHLLERSSAYVVYRLPAEQVLQVARDVLQEQGYALLVSTDPLYLRTAWRTKFDDTLDIGAVRERSFILGKQLDDGRFVLHAYRMSYTTVGRTAPHPISAKNDTTGAQRMAPGDPVSTASPALVRDLEMEWRILSRVAPSIAHELEVQVDEYLATGSK